MAALAGLVPCAESGTSTLVRALSPRRSWYALIIFPNEEVGNFFNEHFVCVKLQLNKTANDDEYVKAWYQEAEKIQKTYKIQSVPTLLFFNSKGEIVHSMPGATNNAGAFIELGKNALDEKQQLYTRLRAFEAGERDVEFLYDLSIDFACIIRR